jgi:hypothetical protein
MAGAMDKAAKAAVVTIAFVFFRNKENLQLWSTHVANCGLMKIPLQPREWYLFGFFSHAKLLEVAPRVFSALFAPIC